MNTAQSRRILSTSSFEKSWAGFWSILFCSYYERIYTREIAARLGVGIPHGIFLTRKGFTTCYIGAKERRRFGAKVGKKFSSLAFTQRWCTDWINAGKQLQAFIRRHPHPTPEINLYLRYCTLLDRYAVLHISAKNVIDFLPPRALEQTRTIFERARIATETVYTDTERFLRRLGTAIGRRARLPQSLVLCLTESEVLSWMRGKPLPARRLLAARQKSYALWFRGRSLTALVGAEVNWLEQTIFEQQRMAVLRGKTAYPGKVVGTVRLVFDPTQPGTFNRGDILVTTMTRPEYVPLMKLAGGIVTDGGGMLSHAAIVARELKKPTVIGTQTATQVLKTGDRVEVDATSGTVRKI